MAHSKKPKNRIAKTSKKSKAGEVKFLYRNEPKVFRGSLDFDETVKMVTERRLLTKNTWNRNDYNAVANAIHGRTIVLDMVHPDSLLVSDLFSRIDKEVKKSLYFLNILDPVYWQILKLPYQAVNGPAATIGPMVYPSFTAPAVNEGIPARDDNVPPQWYDSANHTGILENANAKLQRTLEEEGGEEEVHRIGTVGARITLVDNNPFHMMFANADDKHRAETYIRTALQTLYGGNINAFKHFTICTDSQGIITVG